MSELELHLTTLETSQRLERAGAKFGSLFCWAHDSKDEPTYSIMPVAIAMNPTNEWVFECPAYLASELSQILGEVGAWTTYYKKKSLYVGFTLRNGSRIGNDEVMAEAEARGQVFAAMLEQKMITSEGKLSLL